MFRKKPAPVTLPRQRGFASHPARGTACVMCLYHGRDTSDEPTTMFGGTAYCRRHMPTLRPETDRELERFQPRNGDGQ